MTESEIHGVGQRTSVLVPSGLHTDGVLQDDVARVVLGQDRVDVLR